MIMLSDVRDWLSGLGVPEGASWSMGRFEGSQERRCCVYQRPDYSGQQVALGGPEATKALEKHASVLVHWNKNARQSEEAAQALYGAIAAAGRAVPIGEDTASYIELELPEPVDLGSDDHGIFEHTIWLTIHYEEG